MKTVIFILALFIVNMMISTYALNDDASNSNSDSSSVSYQL